MFKDITHTDYAPYKHSDSFYAWLWFFALTFAFILFFGVEAYADPANTETPSPMGVVVCNLLSMMHGTVGRGLAVIAVIIIGIGASLGKVSWGLALTVAVGIATIFGAHQLVCWMVFQSNCRICNINVDISP